MPPEISKPVLTLRRTRRSRLGFTLVEFGMVTLIIGVMASLGMPALKRSLIATRAGVIANDLRVFAAAMQSYEQQNGRYPADTPVGVPPPGMTGTLGDTSWIRVTAIGGHYDWESDRTSAGVRYRAGVGIRSTAADPITTDRDLLLALDRLIDDGNLSTGNFFLGTGNEPFFVIER